MNVHATSALSLGGGVGHAPSNRASIKPARSSVTRQQRTHLEASGCLAPAAVQGKVEGQAHSYRGPRDRRGRYVGDGPGRDGHAQGQGSGAEDVPRKVVVGGSSLHAAAAAGPAALTSVITDAADAANSLLFLPLKPTLLRGCRRCRGAGGRLHCRWGPGEEPGDRLAALTWS